MLTRVPILSPNYSSRGGARVRLIVLHASEGATTFQSLGNFFKSPSSQVSSHVGIDDTPNTVGEYVSRGAKAWTAANANPYAVQAELCAPSGASMGWSEAQWMAHPVMLQNTAEWIKEEAAAFGIPIVRLTPTQAQGTGIGVCQHADLGAWGGGHVDNGPNFPIDYVLSLATYDQPTPSEDETNMWTVNDPVSNGYWVCDGNSTPPGAVFSYEGAPYLGGTNNNKMNAQSFPCSGMATYKDPNGQTGYVITLDFGEIPGQDRFRRYKFPRNGSGKV